jgi:uncharacterized protein (TIGR02271 family)
MSTTTRATWDEVIKKEARSVDNQDLGEVQEVGTGYVLTQKGHISKDKFYIPKTYVQEYDGHTLWFNCTKEEAKTFLRDTAPTVKEYARYKATPTANVDPEIETRIPVVKEHASVHKTVSTSEARVTKEPYTETKRVEVPVTHEEMEVERRAASGETTAVDPVTGKEEVRIPLSKEHVHVTKEPHVEEEVVIKKKPVTETHEVEEEVRGERVKVDR